MTQPFISMVIFANCLINIFMKININIRIKRRIAKMKGYTYKIANISVVNCTRVSNIILNFSLCIVSKGAKIRNRYNQVPHLTKDTNGKVTNSQLDTTNESQEVSPFPAGDHKAYINRRSQRHSKHKTEKTIKDPQKK